MCGYISEGQLEFLHLAFPRLVLRKSPSQTLAPLAELERLLTPAANRATVAEGRLLVRNAALMARELGEWVKEKAGDDLPELAASHVSRPAHNGSPELTESAPWQVLLVSFLNATLEACADLIGSSIAQRTFEACFPRLSCRTVIREDWKDGEDAVLFAFVSLLTSGSSQILQ